MREVGVVFECLHCETYFVNTVKLIDLSENRGKKKDLLTDTYISLQKYYEEFRNRYQLCVCPTCNELIYQTKYQDLGQNCSLSLCRVFKFLKEDSLPSQSSNNSNISNNSPNTNSDNVGSSASHEASSSDTKDPVDDEFMELFEISNSKLSQGYEIGKSKKQHGKKVKGEKEQDNHDPDTHVPLYMDVGNSAGESQKKQKWELVFGVGPTRLELDSSRSGRLYKPSLRSLNLSYISTSLYKLPENVMSSDIQSQCDKIVELVQGLDEHALTDIILNVLINKIPLYEHYAEISDLIDEHLSTIRHIKEIERQEEMEHARYQKSVSLTDILSRKK